MLVCCLAFACVCVVRVLQRFTVVLCPYERNERGPFVLFWFRHVAVPFQDTSAIMQDDPPLLQPAPPQFVGKSPVSAAVAILKVGWPMAISQAAYWVQNFVTIWLLGANGKKLAMAGWARQCALQCHRALLSGGIGAGIDTLPAGLGSQGHLAIGLINQRALLILTLLVNVPGSLFGSMHADLLACRQDPAVASQVGLSLASAFRGSLRKEWFAVRQRRCRQWARRGGCCEQRSRHRTIGRPRVAVHRRLLATLALPLPSRVPLSCRR